MDSSGWKPWYLTRISFPRHADDGVPRHVILLFSLIDLRSLARRAVMKNGTWLRDESEERKHFPVGPVRKRVFSTTNVIFYIYIGSPHPWGDISSHPGKAKGSYFSFIPFIFRITAFYSRISNLFHLPLLKRMQNTRKQLEDRSKSTCCSYGEKKRRGVRLKRKGKEREERREGFEKNLESIKPSAAYAFVIPFQRERTPASGGKY